MELIIAVVIRGGLGLILGIGLGIAGLLFTYWVYPTYTPPMWFLVFMVSVFASLAGFLAYFKPEANGRVILISLLIAFIGGMAGAWAGFAYMQVFIPEGVKNVRFIFAPDPRTPAVFVFINGAAIGAASLGAIYYAFRAWRYNEV